MTDIPDCLPENIGSDPVDPGSPHPNASEFTKDDREFLDRSKDTPFEEMSLAMVRASKCDMKGKLEVVVTAHPKHPTVACAALSYFLHFIKDGMVRFGDPEQQKRVTDDVREALGLFAHLADAEFLPD